ncbi:CHAT domain-containing protein [Cladorrhinum sp. PSN259]|nr:CHAT domain-containing protein [Cladorrhinum sp. PSN259]
MDDSDETIRRGLAALNIMSADHPDRAGLLNAIALLLYLKYDQTKRMDDLQQAIRTAEEVLDATPEVHPNKRIWLNNLGNLLRDKYSITGEMADLDNAIRVAGQAADKAPQGHEDRAMWLNNFGALLNTRYSKTGIRADHQEALRVSREAVAITRKDDPERGMRLDNLRAHMLQEYSTTGQMSDLEEAIRVGHDCVRATPADHPDRGGRLERLGALLYKKYCAIGAAVDLEEAVRMAQESIDTTPIDHPGRGSQLHSLGVMLAERYRRTEALADLDNAIRAAQEAVSKISAQGDPLIRGSWLNTLAMCLGNRYSRIGAISDLENAIRTLREAVAETPETSEALSFLAGYLNNLCFLLLDRYSKVRQSSDLGEAIASIRKAISLTPEDHTSHIAALKNSLGIALGERFLETRLETDIEEAILATQQAVDLTSTDHPHKANRLHTLAGLLGKRYSNTKSTADLDESIRILQQAIDATPEDTRNRTAYLHSLGKALGARILTTVMPADIEGAISCYKSVLCHPNSSVISRIKAGMSLLTCYAFTPDWKQAYDTSRITLGLIPMLTPRSLSISDKQHLVAEIAGLACDAAAAAIQHGESPLVALEFLEQGRGVLTGSLEEMQADITDLQRERPELAEKFIRLRDELEPPLIRPASLTDQDRYQDDQAWATRRYDAADEFDRLIIKIRQQQGFQHFLLPPSGQNMQAAAAHGPIVTINVSRYRCDAIIVERHQVRLLALPNLTEGALEGIAETGYTGHPQILEWLWDVIVNPVLDALDIRQPPSADDAWPRIWWIPTGLLTKFPLHAAGRFRNDDNNKNGTDNLNALDRVMSSYSLSIKAMIRSRQRRQPASTPSARPRALLISMQDTPGHITSLPFAAQEVAMLHDICESMGIDAIEPRPQKPVVLDLLPSCQIFHFAGHCNTSSADPSQSKLLLEDWESDPLTIGTLMQTNNLRERAPFLAYLSACGTGRVRDERFVDESIHLIGAFQLVGFRHVVGTLWDVNDETCVDIARVMYEVIRDKGMTDEAVCLGLHTAAREARNRWVSERPTEDGEAAGLMKGSSSMDGDPGGGFVLPSPPPQPPRDIEADQDDEKPPSWVPYIHFGV